MNAPAVDFRFNDEQLQILKQAIQCYRDLGWQTRITLALANFTRRWRKLRPLLHEDINKLSTAITRIEGRSKALNALQTDGNESPANISQVQRRISEVQSRKLSRYNFHTAVLLLDFFSYLIADVAVKTEEMLDSVGVIDDEDRSEIEFVEYKRLYERLNRELPDTMFLRGRPKRK